MNEIIDVKGTTASEFSFGLGDNRVKFEVVDGILYLKNKNAVLDKVGVLGEISGAYVPAWAPLTPYGVNQIVERSETLYKCITAHTSTGNFDDNKSKFKLLSVFDLVNQRDVASTTADINLDKMSAGIQLIYNSTTPDTLIQKFILPISTNVSTGHYFIFVNNSNIKTDIYANDGTSLLGSVMTGEAMTATMVRAAGTNGEWSIAYTVTTDYIDLLRNYPVVYEWAAAKTYINNQLVVHNNQLFRITTTHVSDVSFSVDYNAGRIEKLFSNSVIPSWTVSTRYITGDLLIYNGYVYRSITNHISDATNFNTDLSAGRMVAVYNLTFTEYWSDNTFYANNQIVISDDKAFRSTVDHVSNGSPTGFTTDYAAGKWLPVFNRPRLMDWSASQFYTINELVYYDSRTYKATSSHLSTGSFVTDYNSGKWAHAFNNLIAKVWETNLRYVQNQIIIRDLTPSGKYFYKCLSNHTSAANFEIDLDGSKWEPLNPTSNIIDIKQVGHTFTVGNIIYFDDITEVWTLAIATSVEKAGDLVVTKVLNEDHFIAQGLGYVENIFAGLDPGKDYYVSDVTPGAITNGVTTIVRKVLRATSTTGGYIRFEQMPAASDTFFNYFNRFQIGLNNTDVATLSLNNSCIIEAFNAANTHDSWNLHFNRDENNYYFKITGDPNNTNINYTGTKDTINSVNIYVESSNLKIQNLTGSLVTFTYYKRS